MIHFAFWLVTVILFIAATAGGLRLANAAWHVNGALGWAVVLILLFLFSVALGSANQFIKNLGY